MSTIAATLGALICPAMLALAYVMVFLAVRKPDAPSRSRSHEDHPGSAAPMGAGALVLIGFILALSFGMVVLFVQCAGTGGDDDYYRVPASRWE